MLPDNFQRKGEELLPSAGSIATQSDERKTPQLSPQDARMMEVERVKRGRPVRVAFLIDHLVIAGTEQWLLRLIRNLDRLQVEPYLCLLDGTSAESQALEPTDIPVLRLGVRSLASLAALSAARRFIRFLKSEKIDVVQLHFPDSTYFGAPLAWWAGVKRIIGTSRNVGYWLTPAHERRSRFASRFLTDVIANSTASLEAGKKIYPSEKIRWTVIPNGVDLERFRNVPPLRMEKPADDKWRVGIVANLRPVKDLPTFIRAAAEVLKTIPDVEFLIAGEGPERGNLEQLIVSLNLQQDVHLLGALDNIPDFLGRLDVAVLCSLSEGCSNALMEYLAADRKIVATNVGGNAQCLEGVNSHVLIRPGRPSELAAAVDQLLNRNNERVAKCEDYLQSIRKISVNKECIRYARLYDTQPPAINLAKSVGSHYSERNATPSPDKKV